MPTNFAAAFRSREPGDAPGQARLIRRVGQKAPTLVARWPTCAAKTPAVRGRGLHARGPAEDEGGGSGWPSQWRTPGGPENETVPGLEPALPAWGPQGARGLVLADPCPASFIAPGPTRLRPPPPRRGSALIDAPSGVTPLFLGPLSDRRPTRNKPAVYPFRLGRVCGPWRVVWPGLARQARLSPRGGVGWWRSVIRFPAVARSGVVVLGVRRGTVKGVFGGRIRVQAPDGCEEGIVEGPARAVNSSFR